MAVVTADILTHNGYKVVNNGAFFDTLLVDVSSKHHTADQVEIAAVKAGVNIRVIDSKTVGVSFGEAISKSDTIQLLSAFGINAAAAVEGAARVSHLQKSIVRESAFLTHPVFNIYHSETQMLRYMKNLENKDLSLNWSMISLGSCTMKLNATVEMAPITWSEVSFCPC